jgi:hypothetical protein
VLLTAQGAISRADHTRLQQARGKRKDAIPPRTTISSLSQVFHAFNTNDTYVYRYNGGMFATPENIDPTALAELVPAPAAAFSATLM